jgi:hypothetical protein
VEVDRPSRRLLGGHVVRGAEHRAGLGRRSGRGLDRRGVALVRLGQLGEPKSRIFTKPSRDTMRFSGFRSRWTILCRVRLGEAFGGLCRDVEELFRRHRPRSHELAHVRPSTSSIAMYVVSPSVPTSWIVEDVRVVQCRGGPGFLLEAPAAVRSPRRHSAGSTLIATSRPSRVVPRAVHLAHSTRAERREDLVGPEASSRRKRHDVVRHSISRVGASPLIWFADRRTSMKSKGVLFAAALLALGLLGAVPTPQEKPSEKKEEEKKDEKKWDVENPPYPMPVEAKIDTDEGPG